MMLGPFEVGTGLVIVGLAVYYYLTSNLDFWSSRGVKGPKPSTTPDFAFGRISLAQYSSEVYETYPDEPLVGLFINRKPVLMVRDPVFIKNVLLKDFSAFSNRTPLRLPSRAEPLTQHLLLLDSKRWRSLRQKLSPTFTSGKPKEVFYQLRECAEQIGSFLEDFVNKNPEIETLAVKFTTDVIGSCAFGINMNTIAEEDRHRFRKMANRVFQPPFLNVIKIQLRLSAPWLLDLISPIFYDKGLNDFFIGSIAQTMDHRKKYNVKRNDFIDLLMAIKDDPSKVNDIVMADILLAAKVFAFLVAGFETSSATISHALYELAHNQSIQDKLREEIIERYGNNNNGDLSYETVKDMKYLNKVLFETLRKYPSVGVIQRSSLEPYTFEETNLKIPKDTQLWIPVYAIQHDPKIYPEPEKFDPERFDDDKVKQRHPSFYLPFDDGPRNSIGIRFSSYQTKVGLIRILKNYKLEVGDQTCIPWYEIDTKKILLAPLNGIKLMFRKITS